MQVSAYGGKLKYTISYVPGPRGSPIEDADVQIIVSMMADVACMTHILRFRSINKMFEHYCSSIFPQGNDITLVARQTWRRGQGARESQDFEIDFREVRTHSHPFYFCFSSFSSYCHLFWTWRKICGSAWWFLLCRNTGSVPMACRLPGNTWWWCSRTSMTSWSVLRITQRCAHPVSRGSAWISLCLTTLAWHRLWRWSSASVLLVTVVYHARYEQSKLCFVTNRMDGSKGSLPIYCDDDDSITQSRHLFHCLHVL